MDHKTSPQNFVDAMSRLQAGLKEVNTINKVQQAFNEDLISKQEKTTGIPLTAAQRSAIELKSRLNNQATFLGVDMSETYGAKAQALLATEAMTLYASRFASGQEDSALQRSVNTGAFPLQNEKRIEVDPHLTKELQEGLSKSTKKAAARHTRQDSKKGDPGIIGMQKGKHVKMAPPTTQRPHYLHRHPQELSPLAMYDEDRLAYQREMAFRRPMPRRDDSAAPTSPLRMTPLAPLN